MLLPPQIDEKPWGAPPDTIRLMAALQLYYQLSEKEWGVADGA